MHITNVYHINNTIVFHPFFCITHKKCTCRLFNNLKCLWWWLKHNISIDYIAHIWLFDIFDPKSIHSVVSKNNYFKLMKVLACFTTLLLPYIHCGYWSVLFALPLDEWLMQKPFSKFQEKLYWHIDLNVVQIVYIKLHDGFIPSTLLPVHTSEMKLTKKYKERKRE